MVIGELWKEYEETNDKKVKEKLIIEYIPLVKIVAGRMYNFYGSKVDFEDLIGYGILGLIDSIERFDLSKNIKFETYAQIRIRGTIIDNVRKLDWIPRSLRKKSKDVQRAMMELENKLGYSPSNAELAKHMNMSIEEIEELLADISTFNVISLEDTLKANNEGVIDVKSREDTPEDIIEKKEIKEILIKAIENLPNKEQLVISLYYYDELTYKEIGYILELSESRISQIHSKSILKIKNYLIRKGIKSN
ncbi:FliA/WhiG family RNA polymerase sigma factor [Anaerosalibacter massiliensis]|uniref:FliA/WhiG family RNA polymerase sigma factor n=1 Tax=Anaerosalibacter massiliensis TaxID=1347392 RepID=A0A9X2MGN4_9FIRM|nr:FliA/WhiG family RNA polymerase sigma factor [Anaerosalibacter massiliensis]MCR2042745.1 FliA/WhiG family RNA polymerase sigma factor [Anaerosalibacter massiliensis]